MQFIRKIIMFTTLETVRNKITRCIKTNIFKESISFDSVSIGIAATFRFDC